MSDIYFRTESKLRIKKPMTLFSMKEASDIINPIVREHILFIHAWSGCDTTSSPYNFGKKSILKIIPENNNVEALAREFVKCGASSETVGELGTKFFGLLYGGREAESLTSLRYSKYQAMISRSNVLKPELLPPTERAAYYHSLRVYLQLQVWIHLDITCLDPLQWGWTLIRGSMNPIMTDLNVAPETVLRFIHCKCKVAGKKQCANNLCSCVKHGMKCMPVCGGCRGETCANVPTAQTQDDLDDDDDDGNDEWQN